MTHAQDPPTDRANPTTQNTSAERDAYNAGRDQYIFVHETGGASGRRIPTGEGRARRSTLEQADADADDNSGSAARGLSLAGLVVVGFGIWALAHVLGLGDKAIPMTAGPVPAVARGPVLAKVRDAVTGCTTETAPAPATCPQSEDRVSSGATVRWSLYGDPVEGAVMGYENHTVYIMGVAVMTVEADSTVTNDGSPLFDVKKVRYYAELGWDGKRVNLRTIVATKAASPRPIVKAASKVPDELVLDRVRMFLDYCASIRATIQPPDCPARQPLPGASEAQNPHWLIEDDPLRNARVAPDRASGLIEVVGQLRMVLYDGATQLATISAPYIAELARGPQWPTVLQINARV